MIPIKPASDAGTGVIRAFTSPGSIRLTSLPPLALYVHRIVREAGALAAMLGGLDMLAFTAGIGEHNPVIRSRVCAGLAFLGVELDEAANTASAPVISSAASRVKVVVEPTNEEWIAAVEADTLM